MRREPDIFQKLEAVRRALGVLSRRTNTVKSRMFLHFRSARVSLMFRRRFAPWTERRKTPHGLLLAGGFAYFAVMWTPPDWFPLPKVST